MSALHYGSAEVTTNDAGRLVYTGERAERAVPGWTRPASAQVPALIPAQRRGSDDERVADLSPFVRELLKAEKEAQL